MCGVESRLSVSKTSPLDANFGAMRSLYGRAFVPLLLVIVVGFAACQSQSDFRGNFTFPLRGSSFEGVCEEDEVHWKTSCLYSEDCPTRPINDKLLTGHFAIKITPSNSKRTIGKIERCYAYCMRTVSR